MRDDPRRVGDPSRCKNGPRAVARRRRQAPRDQGVLLRAARDIIIEWSQRGQRIHQLEAEVERLRPDAAVGAAVRRSPAGWDSGDLSWNQNGDWISSVHRIRVEEGLEHREQMWSRGRTPEAVLVAIGLMEDVSDARVGSQPVHERPPCGGTEATADTTATLATVGQVPEA
ncbi:MAG: hypothetical protein ABFE07_05800 [Armatimonadia bacterium]